MTGSGAVIPPEYVSPGLGNPNFSARKGVSVRGKETGNLGVLLALSPLSDYCPPLLATANSWAFAVRVTQGGIAMAGVGPR